MKTKVTESSNGINFSNGFINKTNGIDHYYQPIRSHDFNHNHVYSNLNGNLNDLHTASNYNSLSNDYEINSILVNNANINDSRVNGSAVDDKSEEHNQNLKLIINRFGGEVNNPPQAGATFSSNQQNFQSRQSRPGTHKQYFFNFLS